MEEQLQFLASLTYLDMKKDELDEEFGDLPMKIYEAGKKLEENKSLVEETQKILSDLKNFVSTSKVKLVELKDREEKLSKQQFKVRNNKEFDAITKEIEHTRQEYNILVTELRNASMKEENLILTLDEQKQELEKAEIELKELKSELDEITSGQNEELEQLTKVRKSIMKKISKENMNEYLRIRTLHRDAVVRIQKNSCTGCYSHIPPQKNVEIRNNLDKIFYCENCGRILYPEEIKIDKKILSMSI